MLMLFLAALESPQDREMFTSVYEQYHTKMEQVAIRILGRQHDAEDAVQNSFMQVIRHFQKIYTIPCEELPFWLISIVKNEALMILRKRTREIETEELEPILEPESTEDITGYHELVSLFQKLPETFRAVLEMKILLEYTEKEIAEHLNITETAVSTRVSRGRKLLRKIVEGEGYCYDGPRA